MRTLATLDYLVLIGYLGLIFFVGLRLTKRAGESMETFFIGGRGMSWWLLGVSMAATNFSIDTPIAITRFVARDGVSGVWFFWASAISALLVTFLFARLWRRSRVVTDAEIIELRYGGSVASALRLFKGFYFGILFNAFIMGWVFLALIKVMSGLTDLNINGILAVATVLVFIYTLASGFYGVVLTDFVQYFIALGGSILLATLAVRRVGGLGALHEGLQASYPEAERFWPTFSADNLGPLSVFFTYLLVQWWAHKYADGGGKHIQRMLSAKSEDDAFFASLFYAFINYALQVWPWILTALASLLLFGQLDDPETAYPRMMAEVLPAGVLGLVLAGMVGAFMSTIDTHLNLGASYVVNDIYRRFIRSDASERHYVFMSRLTMAALLALSIFIARNITSVAGAWKFLLTFASGAGLTWIARWFWWRVNAWSEFSGMVASGCVATYLEIFHRQWLYSSKLLTTVAVTTLIWVPVTLLTPPVAEAQLRRFVDLVRPGRWGWRGAFGAADQPRDAVLGPALKQWLLALVALFSLNFGIGSLLLSAPLRGGVLLVIAIFAGGVLAVSLRRSAKGDLKRLGGALCLVGLLGAGWTSPSQAQDTPPEEPSTTIEAPVGEADAQASAKPRRRAKQAKVARLRQRQRQLLAALAAYNGSARYALPRLDGAQRRRIAEGELVRLRHKQATPGLPQQALGLVWVDVPRDDLWIASQDRHFPGLDETVEFRLTQEGVEPVLWYGFVDLPWPMKNRQWVVEVWDNLTLAASPEVDAWEHGWQVARQGWPMAQDAIRRGRVADMTEQRSAKALFIPVNRGAWVMIQMPDGGTLLGFHATFEIGGSVPDRLVVSNTLRGLERLLNDVIERARTEVRGHYVGDHPVLLGGDGQPIQTYVDR